MTDFRKIDVMKEVSDTCARIKKLVADLNITPEKAEEEKKRLLEIEKKLQELRRSVM
jgi:hypothetical protein